MWCVNNSAILLCGVEKLLVLKICVLIFVIVGHSFNHENFPITVGIIILCIGNTKIKNFVSVLYLEGTDLTWSHEILAAFFVNMYAELGALYSCFSIVQDLRDLNDSIKAGVSTRILFICYTNSELIAFCFQTVIQQSSLVPYPVFYAFCHLQYGVWCCEQIW